MTELERCQSCGGQGGTVHETTGGSMWYECWSCGGKGWVRGARFGVAAPYPVPATTVVQPHVLRVQPTGPTLTR